MEKCIDITESISHYYPIIMEQNSDIRMNFCIVHPVGSTSNSRKVHLFRGEEEIGYFELSSSSEEITDEFVEFFDRGYPIQISIEVEDEETNKGFSKLLIGMMCHCIEDLPNKDGGYPQIRTDQLISIDSDASDGFWEKVGFIEGRYNRRTGAVQREGRYEGLITFQELKTWAIMPSKKGRGKNKNRTNKKKSKRKRRKRRMQTNKQINK